jgi:hypothetical protein
MLLGLQEFRMAPTLHQQDACQLFFDVHFHYFSSLIWHFITIFGLSTSPDSQHNF